MSAKLHNLPGDQDPTVVLQLPSANPQEKSEDADQLVGVLYGNYRATRRIGAGGMGLVYEAEHIKIGHRAAIKILKAELAQDPEYAQRFLNEARAVNIIRHSSLVEIFEFGQLADGTLFLTMELLSGKSLRGCMADVPAPWTKRDVLSIGSKIASALAEAHRCNIVHRDLKPENVMISPQEKNFYQKSVKIFDFGIAKIAPPQVAILSKEESTGQASQEINEDTHIRTVFGKMMGTPRYMAPEQFGSTDGIDGKVDVFALGVILYELLTGESPFSGNSLVLLTSVAPATTKIKAFYSAQLAALVQKMLAARADERPPMAEVARQLSAMMERRWGAREFLMITLIGGLGILLVTLAIFQHTKTKKNKPAMTLSQYKQEAISLIDKNLAAKNPMIRASAVRILGQTGDLDYQEMIEPLLQDTDATVVTEAVHALGKIGSIASQIHISKLLKSKSTIIQLSAANTLAQLQSPQGISTLRGIYESKNERDRMEAALLLLERGDHTGAKALWERLSQSKKDDSASLRVVSRMALAGERDARQRLAEFFESGKEETARVYAAYSLARLGDERARTFLRDLASRLVSSQPLNGSALLAARLLASVGEPIDARGLEALAAGNDTPETVREIAVEGLGDLGQTPALPALFKVLQDTELSLRLRISAAGSILHIASGGNSKLIKQNLDWAKDALLNGTSATRELAVAMIDTIETPEAIEALTISLNNSEEKVRLYATKSLGRRGIRSSLQALTVSLKDSNRQVRTEAIRAIGEIIKNLRKIGDETNAMLATTMLGRLTRNSEEIEHVMASAILLQLGDMSQNATLRMSLASKNPEVRRKVIEFSAYSVSDFTTALRDTDPGVRFAAAMRLASQSNRAGVAILRVTLNQGNVDGIHAFLALTRLGERVQVPPDWQALLLSGSLHTRIELADLISELRTDDTLKLLTTAVADPSPVVRIHAVRSAVKSFSENLPVEVLDLIRNLKVDSDALVRNEVNTLLVNFKNSNRTLEIRKSTSQHREDPVVSSVPVRKQSPEVGAADLGFLKIDVEEGVKYKIDGGEMRFADNSAIELVPGRHQITYLGRTESVLITAGQTTVTKLQVSLFDQILEDSKTAIATRQFITAQALIDRLTNLTSRKSIDIQGQLQIYSQQGRLYEARGMFMEAIDCYSQASLIPGAYASTLWISLFEEPTKRLTRQVGVERLNVKITQARQLLVNKQFKQALLYALSARYANPLQSWRIVGSAACQLHLTPQVKEAVQRLEPAGQLYIQYLCQNNGIKINIKQ